MVRSLLALPALAITLVFWVQAVALGQQAVDIKTIGEVCSGLQEAQAKGGRGHVSSKGGYEFDVTEHGELAVKRSGVLLEKIQNFSASDYIKCMTDLTKLLSQKSDLQPIWNPKNYVYGAVKGVTPVTSCPCVGKEVVFEKLLHDEDGYQCFRGSYRVVNRCSTEVRLSISKWENISANGNRSKHYYESDTSLNTQPVCSC